GGTMEENVRQREGARMNPASVEKEEIETRASQWILRRDRGDLTAADRMELEAWLSADSRHRETYLRLLELWRMASDLKIWRPADGRMHSDVLPGPAKVSSRRYAPMRLAAAFLLLVLGGFLAWFIAVGSSTFSTDIGGYQRLVLDDGSVV